MRDESTLIHCEHESARTFDDVVTAFEAAVGHAEGKRFRDAIAASTTPEHFETHMHAAEGSSGFMVFFKADHGGWMAKFGISAPGMTAPGASVRAKLYILGNPLIAATMIRYDLGVGLNVPVRVLIYEDPPSGVCRLAYDLPSSLMARLKNDRVTVAAKELDRKLAALAESATGVAA